jgi:hypothetical protein
MEEKLNEIKSGILDWMSIMDQNDPETMAECRRNITSLRKSIKNLKKGERN